MDRENTKNEVKNDKFNYLFAGINIFASALFTALSNGKISAIISFCRTFVFIVASIVLLPMIMGITGVWLAVPLAELITLFISAWYLKGQKRFIIMDDKRIY